MDSVTLGKTKLIWLYEKALFLLTSREFEPWLGLHSRKGKANSFLWPISLDLFQKEKASGNRFTSVWHVLMCFFDLQEEPKCFNRWELFLGEPNTIWFLMQPCTWMQWLMQCEHHKGCLSSPDAKCSHLCFCPLSIALAWHNYLHGYKGFFMDFKNSTSYSTETWPVWGEHGQDASPEGLAEERWASHQSSNIT